MRVALLLFLTFLAACTPARNLEFAPQGQQSIRFWHKPSGERLDVVFRTGGHYSESAFREIDRMFRDRHTGEEYPIDPQLIDLISDLRDRMAMPPDTTIELLSGYRSPETNAFIARTNKYVAKQSYHMKGKAADIRIPEMNSSVLELVAKTLQRGGVALYPDSGHVHVDTGPVREWAVYRGAEPGTREAVQQPPLPSRKPVYQPPSQPPRPLGPTPHSVRVKAVPAPTPKAPPKTGAVKPAAKASVKAALKPASKIVNPKTPSSKAVPAKSAPKPAPKPSAKPAAKSSKTSPK
jgi:uncharacterized protein YcbK (DUF882 family)